MNHADYLDRPMRSLTEVLKAREARMAVAELPDCIAELERLLEDRNHANKHSCGALYQSSRRIRHKILLWEPGRSDKEFTGEDFGIVYRAAYEHIRRDEVAECNIAIGLTPAGCYADDVAPSAPSAG